MTWRLLVRNADLHVVGELDGYDRLELIHRFNDVDTMLLDVDRTVPVAGELFADGAGLVVEYDGRVVTSGQTVGRKRDWSQNGDRLTVPLRSDDVWLDRRLGYPHPGGDFTLADYDIRTGPAETVMRGYVDANLGPGALTERQVAGLTLLPDQGRGATVTGRARFHPVLDLLRGLALAGGDLGFTIRQAGAGDPTDVGLLFEVYDPADLTGSAVFSVELGNLSGFDLDERAPEANYLIVAGGGEGTARTFVEGGDASSVGRWGRIEQFRDRRDTTDPAELGQTLDAELAERAEQLTLKVATVDTAAVTYLADYRLGDRVRALIDGVPIDEVVRQVTVTLQAGAAPTVEPSIGTPSRRELLGVFDRIRRAETRVGRLERT